MLGKIKVLFKLVRFPHTVFALPFALMSAFLAADGLPEPEKLFWILMAMVGGRSAAMAFNRIVDREHDARNPRTAQRVLPRGELSLAAAWLFTTAMGGLLVFSAYMLNWLAFYLSPLALVIILGYSYTKRYTALTHFFLGLAQFIVPIGAWIAIRPEIALVPVLLGIAIFLWISGFDIIYACQDVEFDRQVGLHSLATRLGIKRALQVSLLLHGLMIVVLLLVLRFTELRFIYLSGVAITAALLAYEHWLVKPDDLSKVNVAFFNVNGIVSLLLMSFLIIDVTVG